MAAKGDKGARGKPSIIIRKEEVVEGGHHGGAWKVAYADFVTAMMAFFLLMWLLNATTAEQRSGIADYFSPTNVLASSRSGYGAPFGGHTPNDDGALVSDRGSIQMMNEKAKPIFEVEEDDSDTPASAATLANGKDGPVNTRLPVGNHQQGGPADKAAPKPGDQLQPASARGSTQVDEAQLRTELAKKEHAQFEQAAQQIRDEVSRGPGFGRLGRVSSQLMSRLRASGSRSWTRTNRRCSPLAPPR